jgi:hypothetical protein
MDLSNITVNGVPLTIHLKQNTQPKAKLAPTQEELLRRSVKKHTTTRNWNSSHARSGKCRVIMQAGVML